MSEFLFWFAHDPQTISGPLASEFVPSLKTQCDTVGHWPTYVKVLKLGEHLSLGKYHSETNEKANSRTSTINTSMYLSLKKSLTQKELCLY